MPRKQIYPVRAPKVSGPASPEGLPKHPFVALCLARPRSGKTTLLVNLVLQCRDFFKDVLVFSPNVFNDDTATPLVAISEANHEDDPRIAIYPDYDEAVLTAFEGMLKERKRDRGQPALLILDDVIGAVPKTGLAYALASRYRHLNLSIVICSQRFVEVGRVARECASHWFLLGINPEEEDRVSDACPWHDVVAGLGAVKRAFGRYGWIDLNVPEGRAYACDGYFTDEADDVVWEEADTAKETAARLLALTTGKPEPRTASEARPGSSRASARG